MRDKQIVIKELKDAIKEWSDKTDSMGDAGGLQGMAVLSQCPDLEKRLKKLDKEARKLGITEKELE